ncbi:MAG: hypothetical protein ACPG31_13015 [Planctomycetota bacterium]
MKLAAYLFTLTALLSSCGKEEVPDDPTPSTPPAAEVSTVQEPIEVPPPVHPFAAYAEVRVMPEFEPRSPARHYFLQGKVTFHLPDRKITQNAELQLAASDRMMFRIRQAEEHPNIFLLADPDHCWLKTGGAEFQTYDALDLWIETTMRWHLLRFPWDFEDAIATPIGDADAAMAQDFVIPTLLGDLHLETNAEGFPVVVSLRAKTVRLDDWHMATPSGNLVPLHWDWTSEQGRREEQFEIFRDHSVIIDNAFTPEGTGGGLRLTLPDAESSVGTGDNLSVVELALRYAETAPPLREDGTTSATLWRVQGEERYMLQESTSVEASAVREVALRSWLAWGTKRKVTAAEAEEYLLSALPQLQLQADGPMWSQIDESKPGRRRGFLLPVKPLGQ